MQCVCRINDEIKKKKKKRRIDLGEGDDYRLCWKLTATQVRVDRTQTNHVWDVKSVYTDECELRMNTKKTWAWDTHRGEMFTEGMN